MTHKRSLVQVQYGPFDDLRDSPPAVEQVDFFVCVVAIDTLTVMYASMIVIEDLTMPQFHGYCQGVNKFVFDTRVDLLLQERHPDHTR